MKRLEEEQKRPVRETLTEAYEVRALGTSRKGPGAGSDHPRDTPCRTR